MNAGATTTPGTALATGLDRLLCHLAGGGRLPGRYALLAHHASVTADLVPAHLALAASPAGAPDLLLGPEHGYYGVEQDMVPAAPGRDPWTGARIVSLYGDSEGSLRPDPEVFEGVDLLVIDLQDVGARYYTYAASVVWAARAALAAGTEVWVLDRPNPLGGTVVEGNLPTPGYESFVGAFHLPVRHGLTLGELVRLELGRPEPAGAQAPGQVGAQAAPGGLTVWRMDGWSREMEWEATGRPWIAPSPNMPTAATARLYPGGCLIEATQISEGRGTTRPFHLIGAPGVDPPALARALGERLGHDGGLAAIPTYFRPQFQKHAGARCGGVELVVTDAARFRSYRAGVVLLAALAEVAPDAFAWRAEPYEFVHDRPAIDLLAGTDALRLALEADPSPVDPADPADPADLTGRDEVARALDRWLATWAADETAFRALRRPALLYPEPPSECRPESRPESRPDSGPGPGPEGGDAPAGSVGGGDGAVTTVGGVR